MTPSEFSDTKAVIAQLCVIGKVIADVDDAQMAATEAALREVLESAYAKELVDSIVAYGGVLELFAAFAQFRSVAQRYRGTIAVFSGD